MENEGGRPRKVSRRCRGQLRQTDAGAPTTLNDTRTGWTAGAGVEWAFIGNWSAKVEYLYVSLGDADASSFGVPSQAPSLVDYHWNDTNFHVVRFGLNYKFGGPY